jgi:S1-C subfamily serine protease
MIKRILLGVILFIYIILIFFSACTSLNKKQPHLVHVRKMEKIFKNYDDNLIPNENFVFLEKLVYVDKATGLFCDKKMSDALCKFTTYSTGSAIAIDYEEDRLKILTAYHVCGEVTEEAISLIYQKKNGEYDYPYFNLIASFYGKNYIASIIDYDIENDICLLELESEFAYKAKKIQLAKEKPKLGETLYAISSPRSIYSVTTRFHFHGAFAGCDSRKIYPSDFCYFSIPAAPGSSGSGVFNKNGELISLISITLDTFPEISAGPRQYFIERLIRKNK